VLRVPVVDKEPAIDPLVLDNVGRFNAIATYALGGHGARIRFFTIKPFSLCGRA
jgi:hypothetical protein